MKPKFPITTLAVLCAFTGPALTQTYEPVEGDAVVVYINKFKAAGYERARQIMVEGFGSAMTESGQTRRTFWVANPETHEIMGISFFQKGHSVDQWHDHDARQKILQQLEPLRSSAQVIEHYKVIGAHATSQ